MAVTVEEDEAVVDDDVDTDVAPKIQNININMLHKWIYMRIQMKR